VAVEQVAEGVEFADAPFGGGGQVGLDEREVGESFDGAPGSSGAALLDLDRADCPLGFVVGENVQVRAGSKAQDQVLEAEEPAGDTARVLRGGGAPVEVAGEAGGGEFPVAGDQLVEDRGVQDGLAGLAGSRSGVAGIDQQARHLRCPFLLRGLEAVQALEVPEQVNAAPGVQRIGEVPVAGVAVADDDAGVAGQHAAGVDRVR